MSLAETSGPDGGVPTATAVFVKLAATLAFVHWYVTCAPGAIEASAGRFALVFEQPGARASATRTLVSATLPSFVTSMPNVTVEPLTTDCTSGVFEIEMCGPLTNGFSFASPHAVA